MKILIVISQGARQSFLVRLHTEKLRREVRDLVARRKNSLAMATALSKGRLEKEVACHEIHRVEADLMLSEDSANWDLTRRKIYPR